MPEREFELYLGLLGKLLRLSPEQTAAIENELRDHLEARFEELVQGGLDREAAIRQSLDEFGEAAGLAREFTQLSKRSIRRKLMRMSLATAALIAFGLLIVRAFLPPMPNGPVAENLVAQDQPAADIADEPAATPIDVDDSVVSIDPVDLVAPPLKQNVTVLFDNVELTDALSEISRQIDVPILLDRLALEDEAITGDEPITMSAENEPVCLVLNRTIAGVSSGPLAWYWEDEIIHVTTASEHEETMLTRSQSIRDLLEQGYTADALLNTLQSCTGGPWLDIDGVGGTLSGFGDLLVVRQSYAMHLEVDALLAALRASGRERRVLEPAVHEALREQLATRGTVQYDDAPLAEVLQDVSEMSGIPIVIDTAALEEYGVSRDTSVSISLADLPLRTILKYLLVSVAGVPCDTILRDGTLVVTAKEIADEHLRTVVYDVADIVGDDDQRLRNLVDIVEGQTSGPWLNLDGIGGVIVTPHNDVLIVQQSQRAHREIRELLLTQARETALARAEGRSVDFTASLLDTLETRYYRVDAATANDLVTVIPEFVAPGTWESTVDADGLIVGLDEDGVGRIRKVAAGTSLQTEEFGFGGGAGGGFFQVGDLDPETDEGSLVAPTVLIITHQRSVHRQIQEFLRRIGNATADGTPGFGG